MLRANQPKIEVAALSAAAKNITEQLKEQSIHYQQRCLILLDPFLTPLNDPIIDYCAGRRQLYPVPIMHPSIQANKRPLLLELDLTNLFEQQVLSYTVDKALSQLSAEYLSYGGGQQYCAWLFTQSPALQVARDLANLCIQKRQRKTFFLRFYDPAIFAQLMSVLEPHQQTKLVGQISHWGRLNYTGELVMHSTDQPLKPVLSGQLGLFDEQLDQLYCIGINNQIIQTQRIMQPTMPIDPIGSLKHITPCVMRMLAKSIKDDPLLVKWATLAIKFGADFDLEPLIQNKIQHLTKSQQYDAICNELNALSHDDWQVRQQGIRDE
ncbi:DUF4123 domain-containing protein [Orbus sturtevantii]|uniref:DUF4123 domain-containing protein n=1 Tax=Orbus sturtevantii TaxID=3074109 RepID=UPI00370D19EE